MAVELRAEHFDDLDREDVVSAGHVIVAMTADITHHHSAGDGWYRDVTDDPAETARLARDLIEAVEQAVRQARRLLNQGTRTARLRAARDQHPGEAR